MAEMVHQRSGPRLRWASILPLTLCLALIASYLLLWLLAYAAGQTHRTDFLAFYSASAMTIAGDGAHLYDPAFLTRYEAAALGDDSVTQAMLFLNPPYVALAMAPLALAPLPTAYVIWAALQLGLLVWAVRLALTLAGTWSSQERRLMVLALLAFQPLFITLLLGNLSLLILVCLLQVILALRDNQPRRAGLWLAAGLIKPQLWLLIVVMLLVSRRWRVLLMALLTGLAGAAVATAVLGWQIWLDWLRLLLQFQGDAVETMYTLRATLAVWQGGEQAGLPVIGGWLALLLAVAATARLWWPPVPRAWPVLAARLGLTVTLGLLVSPHLYPHDSLLLVAPGLLAYTVAREHPALRPRMAVFLLSALLVFSLGVAIAGVRLGVQLPVVQMSLLAVILWRLGAVPGRQTSASPSLVAGERP